LLLYHNNSLAPLCNQYGGRLGNPPLGGATARLGRRRRYRRRRRAAVAVTPVGFEPWTRKAGPRLGDSQPAKNQNGPSYVIKFAQGCAGV